MTAESAAAGSPPEQGRALAGARETAEKRPKRAGAGLWRQAAVNIFDPAPSRQFPPILGPPIPAPLVGGIRLAGVAAAGPHRLLGRGAPGPRLTRIRPSEFCVVSQDGSHGVGPLCLTARKGLPCGPSLRAGR